MHTWQKRTKFHRAKFQNWQSQKANYSENQSTLIRGTMGFLTEN